MFFWLTRLRNRVEMPEYRALRAQPSRGLPQALQAREASEEHRSRCERIQEDLLRGPERPADGQPLLIAFTIREPRGMLTIPLPDGSQCLPLFTSPFRAGDYARTLLSRGPGVQYLVSSPAQCTTMLNDLRETGIRSVALDRCPRCAVMTAFSTSSVTSAADVVTLWGIHKSTELARLELYFAFACEVARSGHLELARDVALETVGHVTMEHARLHILLGKLGVLLKDRALRRDAEAFLMFLNVPDSAAQLEEPI